MPVVLINDTTMTDIADAIRSKDSSSEKILPSEMAGKIQGISTSSIGVRTPISIKSITKATTITGKGTICSNSLASITIDGTKITPEEVGDIVYQCYYYLEFEKSVIAPKGSVVILY